MMPLDPDDPNQLLPPVDPDLHPQAEPEITPYEPEKIIPLPEEGRGSYQFWKKEVEASDEKIKHRVSDWERNILSYRAKSLIRVPVEDSIVVPRDFSFVEQKKAQLFFQVPEVHLTPEQPELDDAVFIFQHVINHYLGEDEVNALAVMNEVGFDALCPSGLMVSVIGYENFQDGTKPIQVGQKPDPMAPTSRFGDALGLSPMPAPAMIPIMQEVPNIIRDRFFWERLSPAAVIIPHNFHGSIYDKALYLGYRFEDDWEVIRLRYNLPLDMEAPTSKNSDRSLILDQTEKSDSTVTSKEEKVKGFVIFYRCAYVYPEQEKDPEVFYQLVMLDGQSKPLVHRLSPLQEKDQETGELKGMLGNPVHIGSLRYVSDSAYPPSECTISRATNEELNKSRTQMILQRDRSTPMRFADMTRIGGDAGLEKLRKNIMQGIIPMANLDVNNPPIVAVGLAAYPRENFTFNDYLDKDLGEIWAMGANQRGQQTENRLSATEISKIDQWASTRLDAERRQMLKYFVAGVRKLAGVIQLRSNEERYIQVEGPNRAKRLEPWDKDRIQGKFAFTANPDSAIRVDEAQARTQSLKLYDQLAKDPNVQRVELLYEICKHWNLDPTKVVIPQIPEKGPDPANVSFRFNAEDINVQNPNFPIYLAILKEAGYKTLDVPDQTTGKTPIQMAMEYAAYQAAIMGAAAGAPMAPGQPPTLSSGVPSSNGGQPEHPGAAPKADHVSKHKADETGNPSGRPPMDTNTTH